MNIDQIARLAEVSTATVSRTLNGSTAVRPETAARIRKIVEDFGYVPNQSARSLSLGQSRLFAAIVSDITNPFVAELVDAFEKQCSAGGYDAIIASAGHTAVKMEHCVQRMIERRVDGIAIFTSDVDARSASLLHRFRIPAVGLAYGIRQSAFEVLRVDFTDGIGEALRHLAGLGHRDIGFITGTLKFFTARARLETFRMSMSDCNLRVVPEWIVEGDFQMVGGLSATRQLLRGTSRPTAILCSNDQMALAAMQAIRDAGLSVPGDISVIGTDDLLGAALASPPLTTIRIPREVMARTAFERLVASVRSTDKASVGETVLTTSLVVRESTGRPAGQVVEGGLEDRLEGRPVQAPAAATS